MFTKNIFKQNDPVAEAISKIAEADYKSKMEELKGQQHKIDKNKNNKIDAQDFAILRGEKKAMKKEETEQIDELTKDTLKSYVSKATDSARVMPGYGTKAEKSKKTIRQVGISRATEKLAKEEVEQQAESSHNPFSKDYKSQMPSKPGEKAGFDSKKISTGTVYSRKPPKEEPKKDKQDVAEGTESEQEYHDRMHRLAAGYKDMSPEIRARKEKIPGWKDQYNQALAYAEKHPKKEEPKKEEIDPKDMTTDTLKGRLKGKSMNSFLSQKVLMDVPGNVKEEAEQVEERTLTPGETKEKERIVKGMKKSLKGFKARYGERAKEVMYATATKAAKKD